MHLVYHFLILCLSLLVFSQVPTQPAIPPNFGGTYTYSGLVYQIRGRDSNMTGVAMVHSSRLLNGSVQVQAFPNSGDYYTAYTFGQLGKFWLLTYKDEVFTCCNGPIQGGLPTVWELSAFTKQGDEIKNGFLTTKWVSTYPHHGYYVVWSREDQVTGLPMPVAGLINYDPELQVVFTFWDRNDDGSFDLPTVCSQSNVVCDTSTYEWKGSLFHMKSF
eukprot:TRINITY_DN1575_c0_g1_i1.p1 TRINITY_DN1575_c0_g1~~TRINITY_DN1575_c0_g1_i1.p1  ORF type:complete len:217 (+),score=29.54 TRINITY_DN1575_c0_g1_i1:76-726(+)